jgi:hypothetical protein
MAKDEIGLMGEFLEQILRVLARGDALVDQIFECFFETGSHDVLRLWLLRFKV